MDDPFNPRSQNQAMANDLWHAEMARKSQDTIRVLNPLSVKVYGKDFNLPAIPRKEYSPSFASNGDYFITWEQGRFRVPFGGTNDIQRYIADKYTREMTTFIINYYGRVTGEKILERVGKERPEILLDKYLENNAVWDKVPRTDDEQLLLEIYPQIQLGLVHRHGMDRPDDEQGAPAADLKTSHEKALEALEDRIVVDEYPEASKKEVEREVVLNEN